MKFGLFMLTHAPDGGPEAVVYQNAFDQARLEHLLPAVKTLHVGPGTFHVLRGDKPPILRTNFLDCRPEQVIFTPGPATLFRALSPPLRSESTWATGTHHLPGV